MRLRGNQFWVLRGWAGGAVRGGMQCRPTGGMQCRSTGGMQCRSTGGMQCRSTGFTLLEAIFAIVIIAAATAALLQLRSQLLQTNSRIAATVAAERHADAIFQMLTGGALPPPTADPQTGLPVWHGEYLGDAFTITHHSEQHDNPALGEVSYSVQPEVLVHRYTVSWREREIEFLWHR